MKVTVAMQPDTGVIEKKGHATFHHLLDTTVTKDLRAAKLP